MDHWTAVLMMATQAARVTWCAAATTVRSLELTTIRRTTAAIYPRTSPAPSLQSSCLGLPCLHPPARGAVAGTMTGGVAALQRIPVVRARVTVTDLETAESMTGTEAAGLDWCAAVTTVRSSELITTRRMTAARDHQVDPQTGVPGQAGGVLPQVLSGGNSNARRDSAPLITVGW